MGLLEGVIEDIIQSISEKTDAELVKLNNWYYRDKHEKGKVGQHVPILGTPIANIEYDWNITVYVEIKLELYNRGIISSPTEERRISINELEGH